MNNNNHAYEAVLQMEGNEGPEDRNYQNFKKLLQLVEKAPADVEIYIGEILEDDKNLINYQYCKEKKLRSLLHIVKYKKGLPYETKQKIINTIIDVGYRLFPFNVNNSKSENRHALFFAAAKGDTKLEELVEYFRGSYNIEALHDTKEGDTVLSFMLKFGNFAQPNFINCFELFIRENIDCQRFDYYKSTVKDIIKKEKTFLKNKGNTNEHYNNLSKIEDIITANSKYQLFQSVVDNGANFKRLLEQNKNLIDSDDGENTLLQLAIIKNNVNITKALLQNGANPNHIVDGRNEEFPIILAAKLSREEIFQEIFHNQNLKITSVMFEKVPQVKTKFLNYLLDHNYEEVVRIEGEEEETEESNYPNCKKLLQLVEKAPPDVEKDIGEILEKDKNLINYQYCKEKKLRSLLHILKYNKNLSYEIKERIINKIIDVGYRLFPFDVNNSKSENCHALFFAAAKGDTKLEELVKYFKGRYNIEALHDTKEGDTVLSFMLKFGNFAQPNFIDCFKLFIKENIDYRRFDYYKSTVKDVIEKEKEFLRNMENTIHYTKLTDIEGIIPNYNITVNSKYQLFQSVIDNGANFQQLLEQNNNLIDSDDGENTLLQLAIVKNDKNVTNALLQNGANPNRIVLGRNVECPIILAAKLRREDIFQEILNNQNLKITSVVFEKLVPQVKTKFLNYLLEYKTLNVEFEYKSKTPLYYAIIQGNRKAIQSLLQRGARLTENCLCIINPKDLEEYFNSCIIVDRHRDHMEEYDYKLFLVFDIFINYDRDSPESNPNIVTVNESDSDNIVRKKFDSEIETIRRIGSNKRLKHLLEHPLIYIFIFLKWFRVRYYYFAFVFSKFVFYGGILSCLLNSFADTYQQILLLGMQSTMIFSNLLEFKLDFGRYTLQVFGDILTLLLLCLICVLKYITNISDITKQLSAFLIISTSISMLLTLGYHIDLSKWISMAERVFKNFCILLCFSILPILAFAIAFKLLLPFHNQEVVDPKENEDFNSLPRALFRTFVMLAGDIGDKKFSNVGGYIIFLLFAIGMGIILMNFWTGVAVSDIREIEEQSTIVAFVNVIIFIESVERIHQFYIKLVLPSRWRRLIHTRIPLPFLKCEVKLEKEKKSESHYGIDLFINAEMQFKKTKCFKSLRLENDIISKIKSLCNEKDRNVDNTLKYLIDQTKTIGEIHTRTCKLENCLKKIEGLLESKTIANLETKASSSSG